MVTVYCYERCTTCKKALKWLDEQGVQYDVIDIKGDHPSASQLKGFYEKSGLPLKRFLNTSGQLYRQMELTKKLPEMSEQEQLELLGTDGMLVKRPMLITEETVLTGFKEEAWKEALGL